MDYTEQKISSSRELLDDLRKVVSVEELKLLADKIYTLKGIGDEFNPNYISVCLANLIYERYEDGTL